MRTLLSTGALLLLATTGLGIAVADPIGSASARPGRFATDPERLTAPTVVSPRWVRAHAADLVLLDARADEEAYATGHLPRAVHSPVDSIRASNDGVPDELLQRHALAERFGRWGVA